jgi:hypothetical protein
VPLLAEGRLSLTPQGRVRYTLKTPYRDGTTHVVFEPLDFIARLAALKPTPRVHLTRYHGVFAPHSAWRSTITPAERHRAMSWAQRLKRGFKLDLSSCEGWGGQVRVIASVEDPAVIGKILAHLETKQTVLVGEGRRPEVRGPPQGALALGWTRTSDALPGADRPGRAAPKGVCSARKSWARGDSGPRCRRLERAVSG